MKYLLPLFLAISVEGAVWFDGSNDYITMGTATNLNGSNFTVACWFNFRAGGVTASTGSGGVTAVPLIAKLVGEADGNHRDGNYFLGITNTGPKLVGDFEDFATGLNHPVLGATAIRSNVWNHACITYDGTTFKIFLNGELDGSTATALYPRYDSRQMFGIGRCQQTNGTASGAFRGHISQVVVLDKAITHQQVKMLATGRDNYYTSMLQTPANNLRGWYQLNEYPPGYATFNRYILDRSGWNHYGTLSNGATFTVEMVIGQ